MKFEGNVINRVLENGKDNVQEIKVGTKVTEYLWSDREVWEVTKVISQKEVCIRRMDAKCIGGFGSDKWELSSNPDNPEILVKFGRKYWYRVFNNGEKARMKIRFGIADYRYDWSF
jgi:hypothetical protein